MKNLNKIYFIIINLFLISCGKTKIIHETVFPNIVEAPTSICSNGGILINNNPICNGEHGISIGVLTYTANTCVAGGINVEFFKDFNLNGIKDVDDITLSVSSICNGLNGQDGIINITPASVEHCVSGGILVNNVPVCNGLNGQDAQLEFGTPTSFQCPYGGILINNYPVCNGAPGVSPTLTITSADSECPYGGILINNNPVCNGAPGPAGPKVVATKLCPADTTNSAEYGFVIGSELYIVSYNNPSSHPHRIGLVRLLPGTYKTKTGPSRTYTYTKTSTQIILTCESVVNTITL